MIVDDMLATGGTAVAAANRSATPARCRWDCRC